MIWIFVKGGPVMIPILLGSIIGLAIIVYKLWMLYTIRIKDENFTDKVFGSLRIGKFDEAVSLCGKYPDSPLARVFKLGIEKRALPEHDIEKALERSGNYQVKMLEKYIGGLISIIGIEPLLGFLGTITGLIRAFMVWEKAGANITVSSLASGIYEAMITTAAGLIVAIPYYLICNYVISQIKYISFELSDSSTELVEILVKNKPRS